MDESIVVVPVDGVINPDTVVMVEGQGMPVQGQATKRGSLFVRFQIVFPEYLTLEQKEQLAEILS